MHPLAPSSSGLGHLVFIQVIGGSNPPGVTNKHCPQNDSYFNFIEAQIEYDIAKLYNDASIMHILEGIKRQDYQMFIDPYPEFRDLARTEAAATVDYLVDAGLNAWNEAATILRCPPVTQEYLEGLPIDSAKISTSRASSGQLYTSVSSRTSPIRVGIKWEDNERPMPVVALADDMYFLFFNYSLSRKEQPQYDECQRDYLHFAEKRFNKELEATPVVHNDRLSQLVFSWDHFSPRKFTTSHRRVTFYKHDQMNLLGNVVLPGWHGGTFISTNHSPSF